MSQVPRITDMTGKPSQEAARFEREHQKARKQFQGDTQKYGFGSDKSKEAWRRRIEKTRSV